MLFLEVEREREKKMHSFTRNSRDSLNKQKKKKKHEAATCSHENFNYFTGLKIDEQCNMGTETLINESF